MPKRKITPQTAEPPLRKVYPFPEKRYGVIYVDPPWSYENERTGGSMSSGAVQQYPTMSMHELHEMRVSNLAADDCVLFLWAVVPLLPEAFELMKWWGFHYKTMITWEKRGRLGMGWWLRTQTEVLLVGVHGRNVKPFHAQRKNVVKARARIHSAKPAKFRRLIERLAAHSVTNGERIELFARQPHAGWDVWGNEVTPAFGEPCGCAYPHSVLCSEGRRLNSLSIEARYAWDAHKCKEHRAAACAAETDFFAHAAPSYLTMHDIHPGGFRDLSRAYSGEPEWAAENLPQRAVQGALL